LIRAMKKLVLLVLVLAIAAGVYSVYSRQPSALVLTGIVTTEDVVVSPQIAGQLVRLLVAEGDQVKKDQLVALIAPDELKADSAYYEQSAAGLRSQVQQSEAALRYQQLQTADQINQAESTLAAIRAQVAAGQADLESARLTYMRTENLSRQGVVSAQELDQARTARDAAQAKLDALDRQVEAQQAAAMAQRAKADVRLAYTEVKAPIDGIVDTRVARGGEVLSAGQPIVTLIDPDDLWVRADVEETYVDRVRLGDTLTVRLPSGAEREGTVFYRGVDAAFATQRDVSRTKRDIKTFEVRLRVDNRDRRLAVGMTAYVLLPVH
jgi:HlyD family secretion protein